MDHRQVPLPQRKIYRPTTRSQEPTTHKPSAVPGPRAEKSAIAEGRSAERGELPQFGDAQRILELLAEIAQIEAERNIGAPRVHVERRLQLARAKLEIAEVGWDQTEQRIRGRIDAAHAQRERAEFRQRKFRELYEREAVPLFEVLDAEAEFKQATAELRTAENQLEAWKRADAVLQKNRATVEADAE